jgi:hypothetical protein
MPRTKAQKKATSAELKGWTAIAAYLAIPVSTAQRWAHDAMRVRREGRFTLADADEVRDWLGRESHNVGACPNRDEQSGPSWSVEGIHCGGASAKERTLRYYRRVAEVGKPPLGYYALRAFCYTPGGLRKAAVC